MGGVPEHAARILIVDDHPLFRSVARTLLASRGYTVVGEADCARGALAAAARLAPDGVLLDVRLGAECGIALARALIAARPSLEVVLVSADPPDAYAQRVRTCGARAFVLKTELVRTDLSSFWR